jgi:uncharacterized protein YggU (UPF0235/DUF167 family)
VTEITHALITGTNSTSYFLSIQLQFPPEDGKREKALKTKLSSFFSSHVVDFVHGDFVRR